MIQTQHHLLAMFLEADILKPESQTILSTKMTSEENVTVHIQDSSVISHMYISLWITLLIFLKITTFLSEVWVEISVSSFDHLGGALPCDAGADSNKRQHLALQGEMNYDSTLNLFLWLAFHCFCYYSPYITASLRESYPSAWLLSESTFVQYPGHL